MTATVGVNETVTAYLDGACTTLLPDSKDWGTVNNGDTREIWCKNVGNVQVDVTLIVSNEIDCTVILDKSNFGLNVGAVQKVVMTINTEAVGNSNISWDFDINSIEVTI